MISSKEKGYIGVWVSVGMLGLFITIIFSSVMITQILNDELSLETLFLFIPVTIGLFLVSLGKVYLDRGMKFSKVNTEEKK